VDGDALGLAVGDVVGATDVGLAVDGEVLGETVVGCVVVGDLVGAGVGDRVGETVGA